MAQTKPLSVQITPLIQRQPEEKEEEDFIQPKPLAEQITPLVQRQIEPEKEDELAQTKLIDSTQIQRQEGELEEKEQEEEEPLMKKQAGGQTPHTSRGLEAKIHSMRGSGQPLPQTVRAFFEPRFGYDFTQVRVHTGPQAVEVAQALNTRAFTVGHDIVCNAGQYVTGSTVGQKLLAHELVHVVQQEGRSDTAHKSSSYRRTVGLTIQRQVAPSATVPRVIITQPAPNTRFNIDATPDMPSINCRARIAGVNPDPTPNTDFRWSIGITERVNRSTCPSSRIPPCSKTYATGNVRGGNLSWLGILDIQGGRAVITATANIGGTPRSASVSVNIRGTNPTQQEITARCGGAGTDADRVACHESRRRQFNAAGNPLLGPGGDVGIMQLCNPEATCLQRWDWKANVDEGLRRLRRKRAAARRYLNSHVIKGNYPNSLGLNNAAVLQRETLQRYNGGRYWRWITARNRWEHRPPNTYVARVLACV